MTRMEKELWGFCYFGGAATISIFNWAASLLFPSHASDHLSLGLLSGGLAVYYLIKAKRAVRE
jgi:hypothetical protein